MKPVRHIELIDTKLSCTFKKDQTVLIPVKIRKRVFLLPGHEVSVGLSKTGDKITISPHHTLTSENRMVITKNGAIRIPAELKRFAKLEIGTPLSIFITTDFDRVILKKS
ncbi:hypothetical protein CR194_17350 [Salipaludibacillus keqinensis]|uniref:SpoVT-AbrB domain-containing protein n=1 Tax=Salipaludibacillus keqinensis TaxID=2045207 RepID=A0A323TRI0_9BACI|nr:AbrB/MazE/SpoVT family DNA-binding domain-containing protein [Salipaludibacillus keqinensis]PYZ91965.1 hypothetical protein CR194_17350 [Salipaludibacillus keqinensis]